MLRFVTIEGGDGSGKSRQVGLLDEYLEARGVSRLLTREPGDTPLGKQLRKLLLEGRPESLSDETELFLILADRAQHVREVVRPALEQGKLVVSDRYADSTLAYQGHGRGMDLEMLRRLNLVATGGTMPELTIVLDCPVEVALARAAERQDGRGPRAKTGSRPKGSPFSVGCARVSSSWRRRNRRVAWWYPPPVR